ncbi:PhzF family phenazine biosynthesis protein [Ornithinimicrobium sp. Arc0846-15]|nr:PhzF family phenazine biosynthesis protein [Ornithinimicrobium laminariae]
MTRFTQVDVFSQSPFGGNPVAVVHLDSSPQVAQRLDGQAMQRFANWTNLSETTFLLPPTDPRADYRLRIFTTDEELPFAGHPTLGSAQAWLAAGGIPQTPGVVIQECAAGLITIRLDAAPLDGLPGGELAFAAPPLLHSGEPSPQVREAVIAALGLSPEQVVAAEWVDNGPRWLGLLLTSAEQVLGITADYPALGQIVDPVVGQVMIGVIGSHDASHESDFEVRAFCPSLGSGVEDPVTGSLNAGLAKWLIGAGLAPANYIAAQGTVLGRTGRVRIRHDGVDTWVGGQAKVRIQGEIDMMAL